MTAPTREEVARGLRAAWIADEPIPSAGTFDDIGPLMRKAWLATADYVLGLIRDEREACRRACISAMEKWSLDHAGDLGSGPACLAAIRSRGAS